MQSKWGGGLASAVTCKALNKINGFPASPLGSAGLIPATRDAVPPPSITAEKTFHKFAVKNFLNLQVLSEKGNVLRQWSIHSFFDRWRRKCWKSYELRLCLKMQYWLKIYKIREVLQYIYFRARTCYVIVNFIKYNKSSFRIEKSKIQWISILWPWKSVLVQN